MSCSTDVSETLKPMVVIAVLYDPGLDIGLGYRATVVFLTPIDRGVRCHGSPMNCICMRFLCYVE